MSVRHLFSQSILFRRRVAISFVSPRLLFTPFVTNLHLSRSYAVPSSKQPRDEEIKLLGPEIIFIDSDGKNQGTKPVDFVLNNFDREIYHLICVNPHVAPEPTICKLISKEQLEIDRKAAYWAKKEKKQNSKDPSKVMKTIEISWATAPNDLEHKLKRIDEFLQKGNRVEVILGVKKGMAKQPLEKMVGLVDQIRNEALKSGKEWKDAEGAIGVQYIVYFEGLRTKKKSSSQVRPMEEGVTREEKTAVESEVTMSAGGEQVTAKE